MNEQVTADSTTAADARNNNGTFAPGNQFGRGNPFARKSAAFRSALMEAVTEQDIKDIAAKLRDDAKASDKAATKILFQLTQMIPERKSTWRNWSAFAGKTWHARSDSTRRKNRHAPIPLGHQSLDIRLLQSCDRGAVRLKGLVTGVEAAA
jgi:hypothetical protein